MEARKRASLPQTFHRKEKKKAYVVIGKVMCKLGLTDRSRNAGRGVGFWLSSEKQCGKQSIDLPSLSASKRNCALNK